LTGYNQEIIPQHAKQPITHLYPFVLVGSTFFKLPGQNRHFEPLMQLLAFDPTMIPGFFGWSGGVEQSVEVVPNPSLKEPPLPQMPSSKAPNQSTAGSNEQ
jgi:hypothetical protein